MLCRPQGSRYQVLVRHVGGARRIAHFGIMVLIYIGQFVEEKSRESRGWGIHPHHPDFSTLATLSMMFILFDYELSVRFDDGSIHRC